METVGAFEAKTKLGELLQRVEAGEEILITRRGEPVALLVPARPATPPLTGDELVAASRMLRQAAGQACTRDEIRELIEAGRRF